MLQTFSIRRVWGVLLLLLAGVAGIAVGLGGYLGTALITSSLTVLALVALVLMVMATTSLAWSGFRRLGHTKPAQAALLFATFLAVVSTGVMARTVFAPQPSLTPGPIPAGVHFWKLSTGSSLAYVSATAHIPQRFTPVIFLHGGPGTPGEGLPQATHSLTALGFDVYAYDQLGSGRSNRLTDVTGYTVARHVADLEAIRKVLKASKIILVGRSWGSQLAAAYLAAYPEHIERVVFTSPGPLWEGDFTHGETGQPAARLSSEQAQQVDTIASTPRMIFNSILMGINPNAAHALVPDAEADAYMRRIMVASKEASSCAGGPPVAVHDNSPGFYTNQSTVADSEQLPDPRPILRTIAVPALVMRGECDFLHGWVADEYRRVLPHSTLVYIKGAGHSISSDQPELYTQLLSSFLQGKRLPLPDIGSKVPMSDRNS